MCVFMTLLCITSIRISGFVYVPVVLELSNAHGRRRSAARSAPGDVAASVTVGKRYKRPCSKDNLVVHHMSC